MSVEYVDAIGPCFASLGMASSFMHGCTQFGGTFDTTLIGVISYHYFQLMNENLKVWAIGSSSILHDLRLQARKVSAKEIATQIHTISLHFELHVWNDALHALDLLDFHLSFAAIIDNSITWWLS